jgi:anti-sigma B factor antagonist
MNVSSTEHAMIVRVRGPRVCAENVVRFKDSLLALVERGAAHLIVDLGSVKSIDSSGIAAFLLVLKRLGPRRDLVLCNLRSQVEKSFRITRMDRVFSISSDLDAASESLRGVQLLKAA